MADLVPILFPQMDAGFTGIHLFAVLALLGLFLGFLTGFFGIGGGFLAVPVMNIILGIPYEIAVGSDVCFIIGTSSSGFMRQRGLGNIRYDVLLNMAAGGVIGVITGDYLQDYLRLVIANGNHDRFTVIMHSLFLVLLTITIVNMLRTRNDNVHNLLPGTMNNILYRSILLLLGFLVGIMTGLMGIGGGVVLVPLLVLVVGLPVEKAAGTSLGIVLVSAVSSTVKKGLSSDPKVSMLIVAALLCSSVVGVQLGIQLVRGIDRSRFSCFFSIVIACAIGLIFFDIIRVIQGLG